MYQQIQVKVVEAVLLLIALIALLLIYFVINVQINSLQLARIALLVISRRLVAKSVGMFQLLVQHIIEMQSFKGKLTVSVIKFVPKDDDNHI